MITVYEMSVLPNKENLYFRLWAKYTGMVMLVEPLHPTQQLRIN